MFHITEAVSRIRPAVGALLHRADRALFAAEDERARERGWSVTSTGFGRRRYRDPRFDALRQAARAGGPAEAGVDSRAKEQEEGRAGGRAIVAVGAGAAPPAGRTGLWG